MRKNSQKPMLLIFVTDLTSQDLTFDFWTCSPVRESRKWLSKALVANEKLKVVTSFNPIRNPGTTTNSGSKSPKLEKFHVKTKFIEDLE